MANTLLPGFNPNDYLAAQNLGYTNDTFNALGADGMRNALNQQTRYVPKVQAPQIKPATQSSVFKQPNNEFGMSGQTMDGYNGGAGLNDPMISGPQASGPMSPAVNPATGEIITTPGMAGYQSQVGAAPIGDIGYETNGSNEGLNNYYQSLADKNNSFDWGGAANVGLSAGTLGMNAYSYFADGGGRDMQKEQYGALKDSREYARGAYDNRVKQQTNLGSAFSKNA